MLNIRAHKSIQLFKGSPHATSALGLFLIVKPPLGFHPYGNEVEKDAAEENQNQVRKGFHFIKDGNTIDFVK